MIRSGEEELCLGREAREFPLHTVALQGNNRTKSPISALLQDHFPTSPFCLPSVSAFSYILMKTIIVHVK